MYIVFVLFFLLNYQIFVELFLYLKNIYILFYQVKYYHFVEILIMYLKDYNLSQNFQFFFVKIKYFLMIYLNMLFHYFEMNFCQLFFGNLLFTKLKIRFLRFYPYFCDKKQIY